VEKTYATYTIIFMVVFRFLDVIPSDDGSITVIIILFVGNKVNLAEEPLLVMLELPRHRVGRKTSESENTSRGTAS
jgi:hypothetical protein